MEAVLFIIVIIFLIFINRNINSKFWKLQDTIKTLYHRINSLEKKLDAKEAEQKEKEAVFKQEPKLSEEIIKPQVIETPKVEEPKKVEEVITPVTPVSDSTSKISYPLEEKKPIRSSINDRKAFVPKKSWYEKFKEKNPDLEKFIGENLINKIGILILVLGVSFFVKYAIDKEWINEPARVGIGILTGAFVMFIAHRLKKNYASFSSVLVAGALSIFYFTIYIAFHEYQLFSQTVAFIIMTVITAFSVLVSISYDRQELAVLSLIGGFAVPFMVSTGDGNYIVLFTYIALLDIGILAISYFRKWKIVTILAFVFTTLLYAGWLLLNIAESEFSHVGALVFATVFYFIFSITIVLNNLKNKGVFSTIEYMILIINTFFFFGMGLIILRDWNSNLTGLFTLLLAVYNVLYAIILFKKFGLEKNAIYLLIGLALTFVTLTIPIQFEGNQITLFWAAEAVLLLWLSQKSKINSFKLGAIIVQVLAVISLLMDWERYQSSEQLSIVINPLFIAGFVVSISLFLTHRLAKNEKDIDIKIFTLPIEIYKMIVLSGAIVIIYFTGILEVNYQAFQFLANRASALSLPVAYHFIFVAVILYLSNRVKKNTVAKGILVLSAISIFLYILRFYGLPNHEAIENYVSSTNSNYAFYLHYIVLGCLVYFGYQLYQKASDLFQIKPKQSKWLAWVLVFAVVYIFSNEVMVHSIHFLNSVDATELANRYPDLQNDFYRRSIAVDEGVTDAKTQIIKIGYPILWGIFSFVFLIVGIRKQWKNLRIIALSLLGITVVKLFAYDIKNVSETGKIIAFVLLGVLILVISFVYQRIRKLVVDETIENKIDDEKL